MSWKQSPLWYTDCRSNICKTHRHQRYLLRLCLHPVMSIQLDSLIASMRKKTRSKPSSTNSHLLLTFAPPSPPRSPPPPHSPTVHSTGRQGCWGPWWVGGLLSLAIKSTKKHHPWNHPTENPTGWKEQGLQTSKPFIYHIWVFPKNRGKHPQKWMVKIMENKLFFNGWFVGKPHYFRKHPFRYAKNDATFIFEATREIHFFKASPSQKAAFSRFAKAKHQR